MRARGVFSESPLNIFLERCEQVEPSCILLSKGYLPFMHQQYLYWKTVVDNPIRIFVGDEIGLGKTIEAILLLKALIKRGAKRILILVPKVLRVQWYQELINFFPDFHIRVLESREDIVTELSLLDNIENYRIFLVSIDLAKRVEYSPYFRRKWDVLIVDEAHNLGSSSQRDGLVRDIRADHVIFLSATPHRGDDERFLRTISHIKHVRNIEEARQVIARRTKRLVNSVKKILNIEPVFKSCLVRAVIIRPTEDEQHFANGIISFLQSILISHQDDRPLSLLVTLLRKRVSSSPVAAKKTLSRIISGISGSIGESILEKLASGDMVDLSEVLEEMRISEVDEAYEVAMSSIAARLTLGERLRLKELVDLLDRIMEYDSKVQVLRRIIELHSDEKIIVFTEYKDTLEYLAEKLEDLSPICIYGGLGQEELYRRVKEFTEGESRILIATDVASEGLNLQRASVLVNYEPPWTPVKLEQRIGRIWRLRQERDVTVYNLFLGTHADEEVARKLYAKVLRVASALEDVKNVLGEEIIKDAMGTSLTSMDDLIPSDVTFSEHEAIKAQLSGRFDEFVNSLEEKIQRVREVIASVYRVDNAYNLVATLKSLNIAPAKHVKEAYEKLKRIKLDKGVILVPGEKIRVEVVGIAKVEYEGGCIEFPMIVSNDGYVAGSMALVKLGEYFEKAIVPDEVYGVEEPSELVIKSHAEAFARKIKPISIKRTDFDRYLIVIKVPLEALATSREYPRVVGQKAEDIVRKIEEGRGMEVIERKTLGKYDFYSFDPREGDLPEGERASERYIEVKGHGYGGESLSLTEDEYKFAVEKGKKYWLYIVWNVMGGEPIVTCFRDPISKGLFDIIKTVEEIRMTRVVYRLRFKGL